MYEILYLTWKCNDDIFNIGEFMLSENKYYFKYDIDGVKAATKCGFQLLYGFPRVNSKYFSEVPFKLFSSWVSLSHRQESISIASFKGLKHGNFSFID